MKNKILENVVIEEIAAEGKSLFRYNGKVYFIKHVVPQDIATIQIIKNKKDWGEARLIKLTQQSPLRIQPFCQHFTICGGCKWQMLEYPYQIEAKKREVLENLKRIGKLSINVDMKVIEASQTQAYRNKIEFAFSNKTFLTPEEIIDKNNISQKPTLGFHTSQIFDKIIPINQCFLMDDIHNQIRNAILDYALQNDLSFYDRRQHDGFLRNLVFKYSTQNQMLVNLIVAQDKPQLIHNLLTYITTKFPSITSAYYTINTKLNDTIFDLQAILFKGQKNIIEKLGTYYFQIGPHSFFQTNTYQAKKLYDTIIEFAQFEKNENVLDLYCGVGSIGIYISQFVNKVLGIEIVKEAIDDARVNARNNNVCNIEFVQGDIEKLVKEEFFQNFNFDAHIIIVDPPRSGLSPKLIAILLQLSPQKIIYVSCNSATQSRDLVLFKNNYELQKLAIVDMFPHTHHIETVALLIKK